MLHPVSQPQTSTQYARPSPQQQSTGATGPPQQTPAAAASMAAAAAAAAMISTGAPLPARQQHGSGAVGANPREKAQYHHGPASLMGNSNSGEQSQRSAPKYVSCYV